MTDSTTLQILSQMAVQAELVRESEQAQAELDRQADLVALAAQLPDRQAEFNRLQAEVTRRDIEARQAREAEIKATAERARAILETAASGTAAWRGGLVALCKTSDDAKGPGDVRAFYSQLDSHLAELPAIHAPILDVMADLRGVAGERFKRLWDEAGGGDERFIVRFELGEIQTTLRKKIAKTLKGLRLYRLTS